MLTVRLFEKKHSFVRKLRYFRPMAMKLVNAHTHKVPEHGVLAVANLDKDATEVPAGGYWSSGIHPWFIRQNTLTEEFGRLQGVLGKTNVVAIGECGLDRLSKVPFDLQREVFLRHIELAVEYGKPVIIHNVRSGSELLQIRKSEAERQQWLLHGFHGSEREAELFLQQGCHLGFGPLLFRQKSRSRHACLIAPIEAILPETDNVKTDIRIVIAEIARIKNMDPIIVANTLYHNFVRFFKIDIDE